MQYTSFTSQKTTRMKRHPLYESKSISPSSLRLLTSHIQQDHPRFRHHKHHNAHPPRGATSHCNRPEVSKMNPHTGSISKLRCERGHAPNPFRKTTAPFTFYSPVIPVFFNPLDKPLLYKRIQHKQRCDRDKRCCHLVRFIDLERASGRGCHTVKLRVKQTEL